MLVSLPLDVLDRILATVPDFSTLNTSVLTCKTIYRVFDDHRHGIMQSVAANVLGSEALLGPALRFLVVGPQRPFWNEEEESPPPKPEDVSEAAARHTAITWQHARMLSAHARVLHRLEIYFSRFKKDRTTPCEMSKLGTAESERFHRAAYRVWLFSRLSRPGSNEHIKWYDVQYRATAIFDAFSLQEAYEFATVATWMSDALGECEVEFNDDPALELRRLEPTGLLNAIETGNSVVDEDDFSEDDYLETDWNDDLEAFWPKHNISSPSLITPPRPLLPLLDSVICEDKRCKRCDSTLGLNLWNETNWGFIEAQFCAWRLDPFLPGNVRFSGMESSLLDQHIRNGAPGPVDPPRFTAWATYNMGKVLADLFALPDAALPELVSIRVRTDGFATFSPDDWLCMPCLESMATARVWIWWLHEKLSGRVAGALPLKPDCWHGIDCRTQVHKREHASKLNHLCTNTKPDRRPPPPPPPLPAAAHLLAGLSPSVFAIANAPAVPLLVVGPAAPPSIGAGAASDGTAAVTTTDNGTSVSHGGAFGLHAAVATSPDASSSQMVSAADQALDGAESQEAGPSALTTAMSSNTGEHSALDEA